MANYRKLSRLIVDVIHEAQTLGGYEGGLNRRQIQALLLARGVVMPKYALSKKLWDMRINHYRKVAFSIRTEPVYKTPDGARLLKFMVSDSVKITSYQEDFIHDDNEILLEWQNNNVVVISELANLNLRLLYIEKKYWAFTNNMILAGFRRYSLKVATYKKKTKYGVYDKSLRRCVVWSNTQEEAEKLLTMYQGNKRLGF